MCISNFIVNYVKIHDFSNCYINLFALTVYSYYLTKPNFTKVNFLFQYAILLNRNQIHYFGIKYFFLSIAKAHVFSSKILCSRLSKNVYIADIFREL